MICVDAGSVFQPAALNRSVAGAIYVRGTATFPGGGLSGGFLLDNYGTVSFPSGLNANGAITINNRLSLSRGGGALAAIVAIPRLRKGPAPSRCPGWR